VAADRQRLSAGRVSRATGRPIWACSRCHIQSAAQLIEYARDLGQIGRSKVESLEGPVQLARKGKLELEGGEGALSGERKAGKQERQTQGADADMLRRRRSRRDGSKGLKLAAGSD